MVRCMRCGSWSIALCAALMVVLGCSDEAGLNDGPGNDPRMEDEEANGDEEPDLEGDGDGADDGDGDGASDGDGNGDGEEDPPELTLAEGIEIEAVEAFQTVEVPVMSGGEAVSGEVPLVAGRETLFRVLVSTAAGWTAKEVTAQVVLEGAAGSAQGQEVVETRMVVAGSSIEADRSTAFEVRVPGELMRAGVEVSFRVVGEGTQSVSEGGELGGRYPRDGSAMDLAVRDTTGELHVVIVPMRYDTDGSGRMPDVSPEQLGLFEDALRALYPMNELLLEVRDPISWTGSVRWGNFTQELRALKQADGADEAYYYGVIRPAETFDEYCGGGCTTGQSYNVASAEGTSYRVGAGLGFSGERWAWTLVHEMGHMHGRGHATCGVSWWGRDRSYPYGGGIVGVRGWDRRTNTLFGIDDATDFMGYCDDLWASDYTYMGILARMEEVHARQDDGMSALVMAPEEWQWVDWSDDDAPSLGRTTVEVEPVTGEWADVRFVGGDGEVLEERSVPLVRYAHEGRYSVAVPQGPAEAEVLEVDAGVEVFEVLWP